MVRKITWRRAWLSTSVLLSGEFYGQKSLVGYSPQGCKELSDRETEQQEQLGDGRSPQSHYTVAVQLLRHALLFETPWTTAHQASLSITNSQRLLKLMSIESVMPSSVIPFCSCLQSSPASGFFSNESVFRIRWPKHWSFSFSISPSNKYSRLVSFRMD